MLYIWVHPLVRLVRSAAGGGVLAKTGVVAGRIDRAMSTHWLIPKCHFADPNAACHPVRERLHSSASSPAEGAERGIIEGSHF